MSDNIELRRCELSAGIERFVEHTCVLSLCFAVIVERAVPHAGSCQPTVRTVMGRQTELIGRMIRFY